MSWDSYIDNLIGHSKDGGGEAHADKACIIGLDGGAKWTTDGHGSALKGTAEECTALAQAFKSKKFATFQENGVHIGGIKYQFLRDVDHKIVYAKKKDHGSVTLQSTATAIVIGHCPEGRQAGNLNKAVTVIAEYLESLGM